MAYVPQPIAPARRKAVLRVVSDGRRIGLSTAPLDNTANALRQGLGAHWFCPRRMWAVRAGVDGPALASKLTQAFPGIRLDVDDVPAMLDQALDTPQADFFTQMLDLQILCNPLRVWRIGNRPIRQVI